MSAEHRRPAVAFVILAIVAAAVVGVQRAEAQGGQLLAAVVGAGVSVQGTLPEPDPAAWVLDDARLLTGGSLLGMSDAAAPAVKTAVETPREAVAGAEPDDGSLVARTAVARGWDRTTPVARRGHRAERAGTTRARGERKGGATALVGMARHAQRHALVRRPSRAAASTSTASRAGSPMSVSTSSSHRTAPVPRTAPRTVAAPGRSAVRKGHRPGHARSGHHGLGHRKASRHSSPASHRAGVRKVPRR